ncbi:hypothetical protein FRB97_007129 [Tulasnella sp. 331]|nr:hypothetical protein FRB97_007129 [Tulasnella sp. 331]
MSTLVTAGITPFFGRTQEELPDYKTLDSTQRLGETLKTAANDIRILKADLSFGQITTAVKSVLTYQDVQKRISECSSKLNWAMKIFQIESLAQSKIDQYRLHLVLRKDIQEVVRATSHSAYGLSVSDRCFPSSSTLAAKMLKALMRSQKVDIVLESTQKSGILLPVTSRGLPQPEDCLEKLQVFAKSLIGTTWRDTLTVSRDFRIHIYLAVDRDDGYLLDDAKAEAVLRDVILTAMTTIWCGRLRGHVCALGRDCARQAWKDGCDWMTLMGNDIELLDEGWMRQVREEFGSISLKEGVPEGFDASRFPSHLDIFGDEAISETFVNQDGDSYLYQLYRRWGAPSMTPCRLRNSVGGSVAARFEKQRAIE